MIKFRDPLGGYWSWRDIRAEIKINLLDKDKGEFSHGMAWAHISNSVFSTFHSNKDRKRAERFRNRVWDKYTKLMGYSK